MCLKRPMPGVLQALKEDWATGRLAAVQTINHRQWQVDYDPLSVFMCFWDWEETLSPVTLKWTKWCKRKEGHFSLRGRPPSEACIKYCFFTAQSSWGELCFIVTDTRLPFGEKHPIGGLHTTQVYPDRSRNLWCCIIKTSGVWLKRSQTQTILETDV